MYFVESVPNFSEGRDKGKIDRIVNAIKKYPVEILDIEMNSDHNRSVITIVGEGEAVKDALFEAIKEASSIIDLDEHKGEHPRFGAADVVPFVPLLNTPMEYCIELARELGKEVGEKLEIPVYLYGEAANFPYRKNLADIRNESTQYEQLKILINTDERYKPDYGPSVLGKAGATIIGAREFLIAFNVDFNSRNIKGAKDIAKRVREKTGGLKNVRALGFELKETNEVQVSMNLINFRETPIPQVFEFVKREGQARGMQISRSELIGMIPIDAFNEIYRFYLQNYDFKTDQVIEKRLIDILYKQTIRYYLEDLGSNKPAPGGGSASALVGALGSALISMVAGLTKDKKGYDEHRELMISIENEAKKAMNLLYLQSIKDVEAFNRLSEAMSLPKESEEQKKLRSEKIQLRLKDATLVPLETAELAFSMMEKSLLIIEKGNKNAISDGYCSLLFLKASLDGSLLNVNINLKLIKDEEFKKPIAERAKFLKEKSDNLMSNLYGKMFEDL